LDEILEMFTKTTARKPTVLTVGWKPFFLFLVFVKNGCSEKIFF